VQSHSHIRPATGAEWVFGKHFIQLDKKTTKMNSNILSLPGYCMCEYRLVLYPHEELRNKIMNTKKQFASKFEAPAAERGAPHIMLATFSQLQMMEDRVLNRLKMIAMAMPAFKVELKDFGSFPSHTIYINVASQVAIQMLVKSLKPAQSLMKTKDHKPYFIDNPHITVARKLLPWQYEKGWLEYSHKQFTGRFIASNMLLLRRAEGLTSYQPFQKFEFMNMPVVTTQGALF
jgi:2'-5' RNA ligase